MYGIEIPSGLDSMIHARIERIIPMRIRVWSLWGCRFMIRVRIRLCMVREDRRKIKLMEQGKRVILRT